MRTQMPSGVGLRRAAGFATAVLAVAALATWTAGLLNPWQLVVLSRFDQPGVGLAVAAVLVVIAARLLAPVQNEATQAWRARTQVTAVIAGVLGLLCWGLAGGFFAAGTTSVLARSPAGDRAVALVEQSPDDRELHVWSGRGLGERDLGRLGPACGEGIKARFLDQTEVEVETVYGTFRFRLDPATGRPLETMGTHCAG